MNPVNHHRQIQHSCTDLSIDQLCQRMLESGCDSMAFSIHIAGHDQVDGRGGSPSVRHASRAGENGSARLSRGAGRSDPD